MRKSAQVVDKLEKMAVADARHAVDFAEVVVLLLDATRGLEHQDLKIAAHVLEEGRALMVAINKWDVAGEESATPAACSTASAARSTKGSRRSRACRCSRSRRKTGKGLDQMLERRVRNPRGVVEARARPPRSTAGSTTRWRPIRRPRPAASGSSCATSPRPRPARRGFVVFGTRLDMLPESYERYLVNSHPQASWGSTRCRCG